MAAIRSGLDATDFEDRASAEVLQGGGGDMAGYGAARVLAWATLIAATGARMVTSAVYDLRGGGIGVLSMCAGCGMGARR